MPKHTDAYYFVTITSRNITTVYRSQRKVLGHPAQQEIMARAVADFGTRSPAHIASNNRDGRLDQNGGMYGQDYSMLV